MIDDKKVKFSFSSKIIAGGLGIVGLLFIGISTISDIPKMLSEIIMAIGQTLLCSCMISILLEISTIKTVVVETVKDCYQNMMDEVFGNKFKYIDKLSFESNNQLRLQLCAIYLKKHGLTLDLDDLNKSALNTFESKILSSLLDGIICKKIERKIVVTPNGSNDTPEYKIFITETYNLHIFNNNAISKIRSHRFRFISQKQNDSFKLHFLKVNGKIINSDDCVSKTKISQNPTSNEVGNRTFDYMIEIKIPYLGDLNNNEFNYQIKYEYFNYEQFTYLTSALLYLTQNLEEEYCIEGNFVKDYIIHGFTHYPYRNQTNHKIYFKRSNASALHTSFYNDWQLPGSGDSVVIRKRTNSTEYLF